MTNSTAGSQALHLSSRPARTALLTVLLGCAVGLGEASAAERCNRALQSNVCLEANPVCPPATPPLGIAAGSWPVFQGNVQHTGVSPFRGPACDRRIWSRKLQGGIVSAPILASGNPGEGDTLFVPVGKAPLCALNPADGSVYWCETDETGKLADRSSPVVGNGNLAYIGTRDNDLWAIDVPPAGSADATVAWRQKVCTDGDITAPPIISDEGLVFMGSDSLGAGTLMAMCPGPERQPKWCVKPLGGGIRNASPALSPDGDELYVLFGGGILIALDPSTGAERWRIQLQPKRSVGRLPNQAPVVNPITGRIYVGIADGLFAIDPPASPAGAPVATLLFDTRGAAEDIEIPPALDLQRGTIVIGVSNTTGSTLYGLSLAGRVQWQRSDLGPGRFDNNNPVVIDSRGRIYLTLGRSLIALQKDGTSFWRSEFGSPFESSPILAEGRLYVGTNEGTVYAIGDCPA